MIVVGSVRRAQVVSVHPYGVYLSLEGMVGFLQVIEVSWDFTYDPDSFREGTEMDVRILACNGERFSASIKAIHPEEDPYAYPERYAIGTRHRGTVAKIHTWCAVIELAPFPKNISVLGVILTTDDRRETLGAVLDTEVVAFEPDKCRVVLRKLTENEEDKQVLVGT